MSTGDSKQTRNGTLRVAAAITGAVVSFCLGYALSQGTVWAGLQAETRALTVQVENLEAADQRLDRRISEIQAQNAAEISRLVSLVNEVLKTSRDLLEQVRVQNALLQERK